MIMSPFELKFCKTKMVTKRSGSYSRGRRFLQVNAAGLALVILLIGAQPACVRPRDPQIVFDHARQSFKRGDIAVATDEAERGYQDFRKTGPQWAWQFTVLRARIFNWQGLNDRVIEVLTKEPDP